MGDSTIRGVLPPRCSVCGAERLLVRSATRSLARCESCDASEDVELICVPRDKWTLVDSTGSVQSFATRAELVASADRPAPPPAPESEEAVLSVRDLTYVPMPTLPRPGRLPSTSPPPLPSDRVKSIPASARVDSSSASAETRPPSRATKEKTHAEGAPRAWPLPAAAIALVAGAIVFALRSSPSRDVVAAAPVVPIDTISSTPVPVPPPLSESAIPMASASAAPPASATPPASDAGSEKSALIAPLKVKGGAASSAIANGGQADTPSLPFSELLSQASAARRSGDNPRARALLERALVVNPGNVEAYAGLGDLSRAGGDLVGASTHYRRALVTSPTYAPALLGLADSEWELGDRASAQRHYRALVQASSSPPERAKARAGAEVSAPAMAVPVKPLTSSDLPPPSAPPPSPAE